MKAVIFGAGNIGRGLVGDVLAMSGYSLTFIDANPEIVAMLSERREYKVKAAGEAKTILVENVIDAADEPRVLTSVAGADLVATAVGAPVLKIVAPAIGAGLAANSSEEVNVIACENVHPNSTALRTHVVAAVGDAAVVAVGFPDVVVDRIVPGDATSADVDVEAGFEFVIDRIGWVGALPEPTPIVFTANLEAYKLRKLWLVNGLHAITAWLGLQRGHEYIHEAMADPEVAERVELAGNTAAHALAAQSQTFTIDELTEYGAATLARFASDELGDLCIRVARNPVAKLGAGERVLGPAVAAEAIGLGTESFADSIVAGLTVDDISVPGSTELREAVAGMGWERFVVEHGGVARDGLLFAQIEDRMKAREEGRGTELITQEIVISNPAGLHARPAAEIVEYAQASEAQVQIHKGEKAANAKSIMSVLALGANTGDTVTIVAEGAGAGDAVDALRRIMQTSEE